MKTLRIDLPEREYDILIARGILGEVGVRCREIVPRATILAVVTDENVAPLYGQAVIASLTEAGFTAKLITVPAGEHSKSVPMLEKLYDDFMDMGLTRSDAVIALGGGVVGDLVGFAAATILRGVDFIQIPTTLLAQVDSSVGGKVAVDLKAGKNLAGCFWQPKLVLMDPDVLDTLSDEIFYAGMAEVVKYGCIFDGDFYRFIEMRPDRSELMPDIETILYTCCDLKRRVVVEDERDHGVRMLLNFGHTLGHAYELAGNYETYTHGQAVSAGMVKAATLGERLGITPEGTADRLARLLKQLELPREIPCDLNDYAAAIGLDKKGKGEDISLIVLEEIGTAVPTPMKKSELLEMLATK